MKPFKILSSAFSYIELALLATIIAAFWFPDPNRVWALVLFVPIFAARLIVFRHFFANTPLNGMLFAYLLVVIANTYVAMNAPNEAPYSYGWYIIGRPLMGVGLVLCLTSLIYEQRSARLPLLFVLLLSVLVGVLGVGAAQFTNKSAAFDFIISRLPQIRTFPGAEGGFNVNEIGGALAFFAPLTAGIAIYDWRARAAPLRRIVTTVGFVLLALALILGQSRMAILGVALALGALIYLLIPSRRWRVVAAGALLVFVVFELALITGVFTPTGIAASAIINQRDTDSFSTRLDIWDAALAVIRDHPLTGVGLNMFRASVVRADYPVPTFTAMGVLPHTHNELLQIGTDSGIPGMVIYIAWHGVIAYMLVQSWRKGDSFLKAVSASVGAGLAAHAVFGLADAITLYDRFAFAYWLLVGLSGGVYALAARTENDPT